VTTVREVAPIVTGVGLPTLVEIVVYGPAETAAVFSTRTEGCAKFALTATLIVPVVEMKLLNAGVNV
jgi:hypothetical protein